MKSATEKRNYFSFTTFLPTFIIVVLVNVISIMVLANDVDFTNMQVHSAVILTVFWLVIAAALTVLIRYNSITHYERPMKKLASAIQEVADGDFSVYVDPIHSTDKANYLDKMIIDFNTMVEELGSVETLKTDFLSNVSHEIKTPLSIIQNYTELLRNEDLSKQQRQEYNTIVYDTTKRLSALISNILKLNKLEKQRMILHHEPYDLCSQLCECMLSFENLWDQKQIEIVMDLEDQRKIVYDANLLELVWNNIIANAIKFTPQGGHITIREYVDQNHCYVSIQDDGCGMTKETSMHIFEKFYQGDTSHATQGNGLGLALAQRVIELSGASISVSSELHRGTTFLIQLALHKEMDVSA